MTNDVQSLYQLLYVVVFTLDGDRGDRLAVLRVCAVPVDSIAQQPGHLRQARVEEHAVFVLDRGVDLEIGHNAVGIVEQRVHLQQGLGGVDESLFLLQLSDGLDALVQLYQLTRQLQTGIRLLQHLRQTLQFLRRTRQLYLDLNDQIK